MITYAYVIGVIASAGCGGWTGKRFAGAKFVITIRTKMLEFAGGRKVS
jgi:hypothetical protein